MPTHEDLCKVLRSYRDISGGHRLTKIKDRFGYWSQHQIYKLPEYTDLSIYDCTLRRVNELGPRNILWSGGVDSTYILCAYISAGVDFNIICDDISLKTGYWFYKWLINNGYKDKIYHFKSIIEAYKIDNMIHGDVADQLFSPDEERRTQLPSNIPFLDNLFKLYDDEKLCEDVIGYGKYFGKPLKTNFDFIRLFNFGSMYLYGRDEIHFIIYPLHKITSFFDTNDFNNVAYTSYWHRHVSHDKPEMHRFICEITGDERFMYQVYRTGTDIEPRFKWTPEINNVFSKLWNWGIND